MSLNATGSLRRPLPVEGNDLPARAATRERAEVGAGTFVDCLHEQRLLAQNARAS